MQFKPVPEPPADPLATVESVRAALPPEPDPAIDCCARVIAETAVESREVASEWITFLRALELAVREPAGYRRETGDGVVDPKPLGDAFRRRVAGADAVLSALEAESEPRTAPALFDRLEDGDELPRSRGRRDDEGFAAHWTARIERILEWGVAFERVERVDGSYRAMTD